MQMIRRGIAGYVRLSMTGAAPERFLNLCSLAGLELWNVHIREQEYLFDMGIGDFRSCRPLVRKAKIRLKILKKAGLPFFLYHHRKRKLWAAGVLSFFLLLYVLSFFLWDIRYLGNTRYTDDQLAHYLESLGVHCGIRSRSVSCEELEEALRSQFEELTWVSARISGTRLYVQVKENEVLLHAKVSDESPCDLVASGDGRITSIVVRSGIPKVKKGDEVKKGQLLVSGTIPVTDDGGTVVKEYRVHADADIIARQSRRLHREFPLWHVNTIQTGRVRRGLTLSIHRKQLVWLLPACGKNSWQTVTVYRKLCLFGDFFLPVSLGMITSNEISRYDTIYTEKELSAMAQDFQTEVSENLMEKGVHIIENNVKILVNDSWCRLEAALVTEESIKEESIKEEQQGEQQIDEHYRDGN